MSKPKGPHCTQCSASRINGVFCHEAGCPNAGKRWIAERQEWVHFYDCSICGYEVEDGETCDCQDATDDGDCGSCGANLGYSETFPWHYPDEDCRALREPGTKPEEDTNA